MRLGWTLSTTISVSVSCVGKVVRDLCHFALYFPFLPLGFGSHFVFRPIRAPPPRLLMPLRSRSSVASGTVCSTKVDDLPLSHMKSSADKSTVPITPVTLGQDTLPAPVTQGEGSSDRRGRQKKSARIDRGLRVHWDRFRRKLGTGTAPSTSSALDDSTAGDSSSHNRSQKGGQLPEDPDEIVDEVIVDREWSDEIKSSSVTHSEHGGSPEKSGGSNHLAGTNTDHESVAIHVDGFWALCTPLVILRYRIWPAVHSFFSTHFIDEKSEMHYNKENWFLRKVRSSV